MEIILSICYFYISLYKHIMRIIWGKYCLIISQFLLPGGQALSVRNLLKLSLEIISRIELLSFPETN